MILSFRGNFLWPWFLFIVSSCVLAEVDPIVIKGSHFFYKTNGSEFIIRGVGYRYVDPSKNDPLANIHEWCGRDVPKLQNISTNVLLVDGVAPNTDHAGCMELLADAGIYVLVNLIPYDPDPSQYNYDMTVYNDSMKLIANMAKFTNTLGFYTPAMKMFDDSLPAYPLSKALIRDARQYISSNGFRNIPIGMTIESGITRGEDYVDNALDFASCGDVRSDFLALHLGNDTCPPSSWINRQAELFADASMPVFLTSTACNNKFNANDTANYPLETLYRNNVTTSLAGGIFYEYFATLQDPGLCTPDSRFEHIMVEGDVYSHLSSIMASITIPTISAAQYTPPPSKTTSCPTASGEWKPPGSTLPSTPHQNICACMMQTLDCVGNEVVIDKLRDPNKLIGYNRLACGYNLTDCPGTRWNQSRGEYNAFSSCSLAERLSWDLTYWSKYNNNSDGSCDIKGYINPSSGNLSDYAGAMTKQTPSNNLTAECRFLLDQAGVNGTGTITNFDFARATASPTPTRNPGKQPATLSIGAKAGIALGAAVAVILVLLLALFVLHRRKQARKSEANFDKPELDGTGVDIVEKYQGRELGAEHVAEMEHLPAEVSTVHDPPVELHGNAIVGEMPTVNDQSAELHGDTIAVELGDRSPEGGRQLERLSWVETPTAMRKGSG
ncbi:uncharacterized protein BDR25DRAFT_278699 [Lindgomyces ingoldianus]|uniref:Uncharacterized protein n=1 Tax=Lindgomyces ingoldianus TaxID=673940 RepID=A0ACB6R9G9_9PLEO|nr:uncharacterized protein BDR25DRAFT_278699 [Lindgomyces ingoldianus]KAF2475933.1 hypothetical protein BDR25DRAFT_278699 [Lindgomyces ingoldianus]